MACPHCDVVFQLRYLISHLEFDECPVLMAKRTPEPVA
jgi:Zn-finger nucleic acid-binding protein